MIDNRGIYSDGGHCNEPEGEAALAIARARGLSFGRRLADQGCRTVQDAIEHLGGYLDRVRYHDVGAETVLVSRRDRWFRILVAEELAAPRFLPLAVGHTLGAFSLHHGFSPDAVEYPELELGLKSTVRWGYDLEAFEAQWFGRAFVAGLLGQPWFVDQERATANR